MSEPTETKESIFFGAFDQGLVSMYAGLAALKLEENPEIKPVVELLEAVVEHMAVARQVYIDWDGEETAADDASKASAN